MSKAATTGPAVNGAAPSQVQRLGHAAGAALPIALAAVAAAGALALVARPAAWTSLAVPAGLALAAIAWLRPVAAVALLLALAPICGTRPTTGPFLALASLTACAIPGWLARLATRDRAHLLERLGTPLGLALCAYAGASLLSLSSLPLYAAADIVGAATIAEAIARLPSALASADVTATVYPLLTVVLTLHALVAALVVAVAVRDDADADAAALPAPGGPSRVGVDAATLVAGGILAGLIITIALGALDRLGWFDLRLLRDVDPFTNPTGAERLQSTFGHAGWFAEYICFATPTVLVCWLWPPPAGAGESAGRRAVRAAAAGALLAVSLVVIVLSYQRGGWITWAVVGAAVAAVVVQLAAGGTARQAVPTLRRLVTIGVAAMAIAVVAGIGVVRIGGGPGALDRFAFRARTITQVSDRQAHVVAGLRIGALQPILGAGSESFAGRYEEEYLRAGGHFYARGYSPVLGMYGSAHNVFAQTFAGKGGVGLIALVLVVLAAAASAARAVRRAEGQSRVVAAIALGMVAAFALYGQVQEVFYIPALQLTVFAAFGLALALERPDVAPSRAVARLGVVTGVLGLALAAHLFHGYVSPGILAEGYRDRQISQAGARLSPPVLGEDGQYFQWTGARAVVTVPRQATELSFDLRRPDAASREVEVWLDARLVDRIRLDDGDWRHAVYPLRRMRILPRRLDIVVKPIAGGGGTADRGVAIRRIRWGME